jgi:hypothetical protein
VSAAVFWVLLKCGAVDSTRIQKIIHFKFKKNSKSGTLRRLTPHAVAMRCQTSDRVFNETVRPNHGQGNDEHRSNNLLSGYRSARD